MMYLQDVINLASWPSKHLREVRVEYRTMTEVALRHRIIDETVMAGCIAVAELREFVGWTAAAVAWMGVRR